MCVRVLCVCVRVLFACMFADNTCNAQVLEIPARPFRGRVVSATRNPVSLMPHAYAQKSTHAHTQTNPITRGRVMPSLTSRTCTLRTQFDTF